MRIYKKCDHIRWTDEMHTKLSGSDKVIGVEYTSKKGKLIETSVKIPMGRKIRQSIILERKRAAAKALREARG